MQYDADTFEKLAKKEQRRLTNLLIKKDSNISESDKKKAKLLENLIKQAARLSVLQDDAWNDIVNNGSVEFFSQSKDAKAYERERPISKQYTTYTKQYQSVMKLLAEMFPSAEDLVIEEVGRKNSAREYL